MIDTSLTRLDHCGIEATPILAENYTHVGVQLGAYCPTCKGWIKWVPQNALWRGLLANQRRNALTVEATGRQSASALAILVGVAQMCWQNAEAHGWHEMPRSTLERAMLVVTELSELSEAARNGTLQAPSDHIPAFTNAEEEWADVIVRVFDHAPDDGVTHERLIQALFAKMEYNRTRPYRHGGKTI
jgi:hypothetical protein